jgi:hypothetical protein
MASPPIPKDELLALQRAAFPGLDPHQGDSHPEFFRLQYRVYQEVNQGDNAYNSFLNRMIHPSGSQRPLESNIIEMAFYLNEASKYIAALIGLFSRRKASRLRPDPKVDECHDLRELLAVALDSRDPKLAFEAHRKLAVTKLFFDVAHTRAIQMGAEHRDYFAALIEKSILRHTVEERDLDIAFNIAADGKRINYEIGRPLPNQEVWRFRVREINMLQDGRPIRMHIYFYSCRSKREVLPYRHVRGKQIYELRAVEKWTELAMRRDASIVSKMLRKAVTDPSAIPDIIGAMFIAENLLEVEHLKLALTDLLGGPFKLRNVTNTLADPEDKELLNRYSGAGYKVFKADADVLYRPPESKAAPYTFTVEIQLYTLETYLRTIHADHYANHQRLKRRQFLGGLAPLLFPAEIYGS